MKEKIEEKELYEKAYIAIPVKESPLLDWIRSLNPEKQFVHMTFYFLGHIEEEQLNRIKPFVSKVSEKLVDTYLKPSRLAIIGQENKSFVALLEDSPRLKELRSFLENTLPQFKKINLPFTPHITIKNLGFDDIKSGNYDRFTSIPDKSDSIPPFYPTSIGTFYKVDGATALLFSKKI